jgi:hypothetical protein
LLGVTTYPRDYVDHCRARIEAQLAAYDALVAAAGADGAANVQAAVASFDPHFFNNLTLVLDQSFVHRLRGVEGKDGNPLNEVRMLCTSILTNQGVLCADKTIKYKPEASVLKLRIGDEVRLSAAQFRELASAYFAEIQRKFT